jgi:hypothetical protein
MIPPTESSRSSICTTKGVTGDKPRCMLVVVGKNDRPKPAVVIFRDAADEPCRVVAHYSLRSLFDTPSAWAGSDGGTERPRAFAVFRNPSTSDRSEGPRIRPPRWRGPAAIGKDLGGSIKSTKMAANGASLSLPGILRKVPSPNR